MDKNLAGDLAQAAEIKQADDVIEPDNSTLNYAQSAYDESSAGLVVDAMRKRVKLEGEPEEWRLKSVLGLQMAVHRQVRHLYKPPELRWAMESLKATARTLKAFRFGFSHGKRSLRGQSESAEQIKRRKLERAEERTVEEARSAAQQNRPIKVAGSAILGGKIVLGARMVQQDPVEATDLVRLDKGPLIAIRRAAQPRERLARLTALEQMANKNQLGSPAESAIRLEIWRELERLCECAAPAVGRPRAIDPGREPVDGSVRQVVPISDAQRRASDKLEALLSGLYPQHRELLVWLLDHPMAPLRDFAQANGMSTGERQIAKLGVWLQEALDQLAIQLGRMPNPQGPYRKRRFS